MDDDIWMRTDVVPIEFVTLAQNFHLITWLFQFVTEITLKCNDVLWCIVGLFVWIDIWN